MVAHGRLEGRKVLVTGAASGIGRAMATRFAAEGASLAILDCNSNGLSMVARDTRGYPISVDLQDFALLPDAVRDAAREMGGLDGLVNCAGVAHHAAIEDLALDDLTRVMNINLIAPFMLCKAAVGWLRECPKSSVVNVASGAALRGSISSKLAKNQGASPYAASKAGLLGFTRALAAELAPDVRVNAICPGLTKTPMTAPSNPDGYVANAQNYALQRAAEPEEIAAAALYLISEEASFVTGATLAVDGGRTFH
jgi:NAD(P)-dependent dehydrogenase (short-subunit alcohol dehydrogenase family)